MSVYVLDLRTMVWTRPTAVNSRLYKRQTLAMAKAEYVRSQAHLRTLEQTAVSLLGRTKHLSTSSLTMAMMKRQLGLDDILEVRQARVFRDVCRWRLDTLHQSYRHGRNNNNSSSDSDSISSVNSSQNSSFGGDNGLEPGSVTNGVGGGGFVPGKRIVSLLDQRRLKQQQKQLESLQQQQHLKQTQSETRSVSQEMGLDENSNEAYAYDGLWEGFGGFVLTRLGQRLLVLGGAFFPSDLVTDSSSSNASSNASGGVVDASVVSVSERRLQRALHPPSAVVLDMEAQSVKQTRWRRNYYASLELFRYVLFFVCVF